MHGSRQMERATAGGKVTSVEKVMATITWEYYDSLLGDKFDKISQLKRVGVLSPFDGRGGPKFLICRSLQLITIH